MRRLSTSPDHVIFIPGFMCDARLFEPQTLDLSKTKTSCRVEVPQTQATIRDMSLTILDNAPVEFALAGLSMGGIIALDIMHLALHRITHLALLNTTPYEDKSSLQRIEHMQRANKGDLLNIPQDDLKPQYLSPSTAKLIQNSDLKIISNCGHLSTLEAAEAVTAHLFEHWGLKSAQKQGYDVETHMSETV